MDPTHLSRARARELLDRIGRVTAAEEWSDELNPAQRSALAYLARANDLSRAPSNVADYLCTTRGTASQTLKSLDRKGLLARTPSAADKRSVSYDVTPTGRAVLEGAGSFDAALDAFPEAEARAFTRALETIGRHMLESRGFKTFGVCKTCRHFRGAEVGARCALLSIPLSEAATEQLCHEHVPPGGRLQGAAATG